MQEIVLTCPLKHVEPLSDAFFELGALSVSVEDADLDTPDEQPIFGEPGDAPAPGWARSRIVVLLQDDVKTQQEASELITHALEIADVDEATDFVMRQVPDEDWVRVTQSQFEPILISDRIQIVPTWHEIPENAGDILIRLDPGLAFGTGSHPTTRLCLQWLEQHVKDSGKLLDYGCGSGILAIAAYKLGAQRVVGIDIDPQAIVSAKANAQQNHLPSSVDIAAWGLPDEHVSDHFDVVVANILSQPLKMLAPMLVSRVRPGGRIALSGVLERQIEEVSQAYAPYIQLTPWALHEGWVCLHGHKPH